MTQPTLCIIYAYYEKDANYRTNLIYFLKHGYYKNPLVDYVFVVNGGHTVNFPTEYNIKVIQRENTGFDFQGYYTGIISLKKKYDYYFFINASVRGPYLPPYVSAYFKWYQPFVDLLKSQPNLKLVGSTINVQPPSDHFHTDRHTPHVQSYCFMMDWVCLDYLMSSTNLFKTYYQDKHDVIAYQEIMMSTLVLKQGWNISCLIPEYQKVDYRDSTLSNKIIGDIVWPQNELGRIVHPYETIFIKTDRGISSKEIESLTMCHLSMNDMYFKNDPSHHIAICFHLGYGHMFPQFNKYIQNIYHSGYNVDLYVTYQKNTDPICLIKKQYPQAIFIQTKRGCDTGAFLLQLEHIYLNCPQKYDYIFKVHTKKREDWRSELLEPLASTICDIHKVYDFFKKDQKVGMIAGDPKWIHSADKVNEPIITNLCHQFNLKTGKDMRFVGGTIFWVRWSILKRFIEDTRLDFNKEYDRCELGYLINNKPTYMHSWERLYGYIVNHYNYKLASITKYTSKTHLRSPRWMRNRFVIEKVHYGLSFEEAQDVTDLIRTKVPINLRLINTNEQWGDPYPGKVKRVIIYFQNGTSYVLNEFGGKVIPNCFVIVDDCGELIWQVEDNNNFENYITIKSHEQLGQTVTTFFDWTYYYQKYAPWLTNKTYQECLQHYIKYGYDANLQTFEEGNNLLDKFKIKLFAMYVPMIRPEILRQWRPLYKDHQIRMPTLETGVGGPIDLTLLRRHINQAKEHGIQGFCFQHYWSNNGCLYHKTAESLMMADPMVINFQYCFSWITETTTLDHNQWLTHFNYLLPYFRDSRYLRINNQPVFLIPSVAKTDAFVHYWNQLAISNDLVGIFFVDVVTNSSANQVSPCSTQLNPVYAQKTFPQYFHQVRNYLSVDYPRLSRALVNQKRTGLIQFRDVMVGYDNTPNPENPNKLICEGSTTKAVHCTIKAQIERVLETSNQVMDNIIFLHSWNDWENQMIIENDGLLLNAINNIICQYQNPKMCNKTPDLIL